MAQGCISSQDTCDRMFAERRMCLCAAAWCSNFQFDPKGWAQQLTVCQGTLRRRKRWPWLRASASRAWLADPQGGGSSLPSQLPRPDHVPPVCTASGTLIESAAQPLGNLNWTATVSFVQDDRPQQGSARMQMRLQALQGKVGAVLTSQYSRFFTVRFVRDAAATRRALAAAMVAHTGSSAFLKASAALPKCSFSSRLTPLRLHSSELLWLCDRPYMLASRPCVVSDLSTLYPSNSESVIHMGRGIKAHMVNIAICAKGAKRACFILPVPKG